MEYTTQNYKRSTWLRPSGTVRHTLYLPMRVLRKMQQKEASGYNQMEQLDIPPYACA